MAVIGITELEAINAILRGAGKRTVDTAPSGSDTDDAQDAQDVLNDVSRRMQTVGWPENTEYGVEYTPAGAGTGGTAIAGDGAWTASSRTLVKASAFPAGGAAGDEIYIVSGTLVKEGYYDITTNADANTITLDHQIAIGDQTDVTAAAFGDLNVTVGTDVLKVRSSPSSPNGHRNLVLNNQQTLYDADLKTSRLQNDDKIYLDITREYTYANLSPALKETILAWARLEFQRFKLGLADRDGFLTMELAIAEAVAPRNAARAPQEAQSFNILSALNTALRQAQQQIRS